MGQPYDEQRTKKVCRYLRLRDLLLNVGRTVLKQCALERDLGLWEAGDLTEVGEKGLTLRFSKFFT